MEPDQHGNRKRMAQVTGVFEITPVRRSPEDILPNGDPREQRVPAPVAQNKWVSAGVTDNPDVMIARAFDEAQRRDPQHETDWVVLVDGNNAQIKSIQDEADRRDVAITIIVDIIHVLQYIWKAAGALHKKGDPVAELWVRDHALNLLHSRTTQVIDSIREQAEKAELSTSARSQVNTCLTYLTNKTPFLDYATALENGWQIATGVIEGACRHIVKDRMDITGARWGLDTAEAVLKLRAVRTNGDYDDYWAYHLAKQQARIHGTRYINGEIPQLR